VKRTAALPRETGELFGHALRLIRGIEETGISDPFWTFGGGTVLMLRHGHRKSKDVDIFVPDSQYLPYVSPRLSPLAESITTQYVETAGSVKLVLSRGEIDFVACPNLTPDPFEEWEIAGVRVKVETAAEIIAKKGWHRGGQAAARDLFDLAMVAELAPDQIAIAAPFFQRHKESFLNQIMGRRAVLERQFESIDRLSFDKSYAECVAIATAALNAPSTQS